MNLINREGTKSITIGTYYKVIEKFACGSFGELYEAIDIRDNKKVAIKVESASARYPMLLKEYKLYKSLSPGIGFPLVYWYGRSGNCYVMVMEMLGETLDDLYIKCGRQFSLKTVIMLAIQMLKRIEHLHQNGYIHRDIKPANFLMGLNERQDTLYLIDMGLRKRYLDLHTCKHISYSSNKKVIGTPRYVSINTHKGIEQCCRDDLEAIGYMLMYFNLGKLPWQGLKAPTRQEKYTKILKQKSSTPVDVLCSEFPTAFHDYLSYCRQLRFAETPNYDYCRSLFTQLYKEKQFPEDGIFDWMTQPQNMYPLPIPPRVSRSSNMPKNGLSYQKHRVKSVQKNTRVDQVVVLQDLRNKKTLARRDGNNVTHLKNQKRRKRITEQLAKAQAKKIRQLRVSYEDMESDRDKWRTDYFQKQNTAQKLKCEVLKLKQHIALYSSHSYPSETPSNNLENGSSTKITDPFGKDIRLQSYIDLRDSELTLQGFDSGIDQRDSELSAPGFGSDIDQRDSELNLQYHIDEMGNIKKTPSSLHTSYGQLKLQKALQFKNGKKSQFQISGVIVPATPSPIVKTEGGSELNQQQELQKRHQERKALQHQVSGTLIGNTTGSSFTKSHVELDLYEQQHSLRKTLFR